MSSRVLADGMTDAIMVKLARVEGQRVISRTSKQYTKRRASPCATSPELGVDTVVEGTVLRRAIGCASRRS
jgi:TolB-like protein